MFVTRAKMQTIEIVHLRGTGPNTCGKIVLLGFAKRAAN